MKQYRAIFIDWDDTIGDWSSSAIAAQKDIYTQFHLSEFYATFEDWYAAYHEHNAVLWERYGRSEITKEFLQRDRFIYPLVQALGGSPVLMQSPRFIDLADRIGECFLSLTNRYFCLLPDAADVVRTLSAHFPLVVVSNGFRSVQYYKIDASGLKDCFQSVILSEEVGCQKPSSHIFDVALDSLNRALHPASPITKEQVLMIGDGYSSDIQGAINAGIDQLWICPDDASFADSSRPATYKVHAISEVLSLLQL